MEVLLHFYVRPLETERPCISDALLDLLLVLS